MSELAFRSAIELATMVASREIGAVELLEYYIQRAEQLNPEINALVAKDYERARARANAADRALAKGESWGPLHGVPMTFKDSYDMTGLATTRGMPALKDNIATHDAVVVQRMMAAGVVPFGKSNIPYGLADLQSYNAIYGVTNNPWDKRRTPGGSSGGSAACLAAGMTGLEAGSDIGGSIRNPAHFCGVYGHKPTFGVVPTRGHSAPGVLTPSDISVLGPLARSAEDLALSMDIMAGSDGLEQRAWDVRLPKPTQTELSAFKVAAWLDDDFCPIDHSVYTILQRACEAIGAAGAAVDVQARPAFSPEHAHAVYNELLHATMSARKSDADFEKTQQRIARLDADDESDHAKRLRAGAISFRAWSRTNEARTRIRWDWHQFFEHYDVLICPVACVPAFLHDHSKALEQRTLQVNGVVRDYWEQVFWAGLAGMAYLPATVAPAGLCPDGLPVGIQIIGPEGSDLTTIEFARLLADEIGGFQPPPGYGG